MYSERDRLNHLSKLEQTTPAQIVKRKIRKLVILFPVNNQNGKENNWLFKIQQYLPTKLNFVRSINLLFTYHFEHTEIKMIMIKMINDGPV